MATTYSQLASLLRSGVPLLRSIEVLRKQVSSQTLARVLGETRDRVEQGDTLGNAMARYPKVFSEMAVSMVRAGGEGGFLEEALERVAQFTEQQEDLKARTIGALAYPVFLGSVGTLIVAALIIFFVPQFEELFQSLRERNELPVLTEWLLWFSKSLKSWGISAGDRVGVCRGGRQSQIADRRGSDAAGSRETQAAVAWRCISESGGGPFLSRAWYAAPKRRSDTQVTGHQSRDGRKPRAVGSDSRRRRRIYRRVNRWRRRSGRQAIFPSRWWK